MSANRYLAAARSVAQAFPGILAKSGLNPHISRTVLTETEQGAAWLFIVLDVSPLTRFIEAYTGSEVRRQLSTALNGLPVVINTINDLSYAVLLSPPQDFKSSFGARA